MNIVRFASLSVAVVVAVMVVVFATGQSGPAGVTSHLVGRPAPPVVGTTIDGDWWDLDDQRGRWVLVNFFSSTCVPCVREHPELVAFADDHRVLDDVRVVSVAFDDRTSAVEAFFRDRGGDWPVLAATTGRIAVDWGVVSVPESYLVSPSGHVSAKVVGGVVRADLESLLARAAGGEE